MGFLIVEELIFVILCIFYLIGMIILFLLLRYFHIRLEILFENKLKEKEVFLLMIFLSIWQSVPVLIFFLSFTIEVIPKSLFTLCTQFYELLVLFVVILYLKLGKFLNLPISQIKIARLAWKTPLFKIGEPEYYPLDDLAKIYLEEL
jgi:hypothetical protein